MKQKGLLTELHCQLAFTELGFLVMTPLSEDSRYDYIIDLGNKFLRIQCKTCNPKSDGSGITFSCRSTQVNATGCHSKSYTKNEIDYFYTYYLGISYLVPVEECSSDKTLRFTIPQSGQIKGISFAKDFELKKVLIEKENIDTFQEVETVILNEETSLSNKKTAVCPNCNGPMFIEANLCNKCQQIARRIVERPSRNELKNLIRTMPFVQIGKQYGVSDNTIRKWCKFENLPHRVVDIQAYSDEDWIQI